MRYTTRLLRGLLLLAITVAVVGCGGGASTTVLFNVNERAAWAPVAAGRLALASYGGNALLYIWSVTDTGTSATLLTPSLNDPSNLAEGGRQPSYSPDGVRLAFVSRRGPSSALFTMSATVGDSGGVVRSPMTAAPVRMPSPTGAPTVSASPTPPSGSTATGPSAPPSPTGRATSPISSRTCTTTSGPPGTRPTPTRSPCSRTARRRLRATPTSSSTPSPPPTPGASWPTVTPRTGPQPGAPTAARSPSTPNAAGTSTCGCATWPPAP